MTGEDFGGWTWGFMATTRDEPPLAVDKVRYLYEGVAAVAAIDEETAEEACELIKVEYEELPGVFDPEEAMREGSPVIHDYRPNNVSVEYHWSFGDVEKGIRRILHRQGGPVRDGQGGDGLSRASRVAGLL